MNAIFNFDASILLWLQNSVRNPVLNPIMQGTVVKSGAVVDHAIIDRNNVIPAGTMLKGTADDVLALGKARD